MVRRQRAAIKIFTVLFNDDTSRLIRRIHKRLEGDEVFMGGIVSPHASGSHNTKVGR